MTLRWARFFLFFSLFCCSCSDSSHPLIGYIEGEYTYVSSGVSGTLINLAVKRGQYVKKGDLLFQLDPQPEAAGVRTMNANIAEMEAKIAFSKAQLERQKNLFLKNATQKSAVDEAQTDYNSKLQELSANRSQLTQSLWSLQQKTQYAPVTGQVFDTIYTLGETVPAHHAVVSLLAPKNIYVLFYVPESLLQKTKIGQKITFTCDNCSTETSATIYYISPAAEYTPPVIYTKKTRDKLVYLIRAEMPEEVAVHFHPGQPVDVTLHS